MRLYGDHLKGAETLAVPDAGHSTFWEQPELFNRALLAFLKRY
jgi:pimeloyl-ACP methyl ester carboxylesterase